MKRLHIGVLVPRLRIQPDCVAVVTYQTRAVLFKETDHRRAPGLRNIKNSMTTRRFREAEKLTPPFNQIVSGAVSGSLRAAKNQNHMCCVEVRSAYPEAVYTPGVVSVVR